MSIIIYYHIFVNDKELCFQIVEEQIDYILKSPIYSKIDKINCCITGNNKDNFIKMINYIKNLPDKFIIRKSDFADTTYERYTLLTLKEDLYSNKLNCDNNYFLYIHNKGSSLVDNNKIEPVGDWRRCMMYFLLSKADKCIEHLQDNDTVGIFKHPTCHQSHYSGNFWWARGSYLKILFDTQHMDNSYFGPEMFLFKSNPKFVDMHPVPPNYNGYTTCYKPEKYIT